jgi:hypothetical protein
LAGAPDAIRQIEFEQERALDVVVSDERLDIGVTA